MKTKYDINQVPEEVLKRLGSSILRQFEKLGSPYGAIGINFDATELIKTARVKLRTTAEVDAEIAEVVRDYVNHYCGRPGGITPEALNYLSPVPGSTRVFPRVIADLLEERESIQEAEAF
jgi:hypothetical protein